MSKLKVLLAERGANLHQLAQETGIHYTTMNRFARDDVSSIHKETMSKVCAALGVTPDSLFEYVPDKAVEETAVS